MSIKEEAHHGIQLQPPYQAARLPLNYK